MQCLPDFLTSSKFSNIRRSSKSWIFHAVISSPNSPWKGAPNALETPATPTNRGWINRVAAISKPKEAKEFKLRIFQFFLLFLFSKKTDAVSFGLRSFGSLCQEVANFFQSSCDAAHEREEINNNNKLQFGTWERIFCSENLFFSINFDASFVTHLGGSAI